MKQEVHGRSDWLSVSSFTCVDIGCVPIVVPVLFLISISVLVPFHTQSRPRDVLNFDPNPSSISTSVLCSISTPARPQFCPRPVLNFDFDPVLNFDPGLVLNFDLGPSSISTPAHPQF
ncbi:hypothetical protein EVAR_40515_1 [Eumeta japonica]|uniref:Uncharacterized protein n=1 Tax=Eumeta variegata TaxID=151549 RepID=A0A4C1XYH4_EUMVA|nr:hypothetical protein EVAR_40515_1 [Eumeta japonica]